MLDLGTAVRAMRGVARLYRFWRLGAAGVGAMVLSPWLPFLSLPPLWLPLALLVLVVSGREGVASRLRGVKTLV